MVKAQLLAGVLLALVLLPAALAFSAGGGPGIGGCQPDVDRDFHGLRVHTRHVTVHRTRTIHVRPTSMATATATATASANLTAVDDHGHELRGDHANHDHHHDHHDDEH